MIKYSYYVVLVAVFFQFFLYPVAHLKAETFSCESLSGEVAKANCYKVACDKEFNGKGNEAKRLKCKIDGCAKSYADESLREECQTDDVLLNETDNYLDHDPSFDDLYQKSQLFYMLSYLISIGSVFSIVFGTGLKCNSISGIIGMVGAIINAVLYFIIILRTNVKLMKLKKALYPTHSWANTERSMISKVMDQITSTASPIVDKLKMGGDYKDESNDGTLRGFQFFIERDLIILENLKSYRLKNLLLMVINAAGIVMAAVELIRGDTAGKCDNDFYKDSNNKPLLAKYSSFFNFLPDVLAQERNAGVGKVGDNYSRSYAGSIVVLAIGVIYIVFQIGLKKIPALGKFFHKMRNYKYAALSRLITYVLYEGFYAIDLLINTKLISLLGKRIHDMKEFSCKYMNEVAFDFRTNNYWKDICSSAGVSYTPNPDGEGSGVTLFKDFFEIKKAYANENLRRAEISSGISICFRKNGSFDENCNCAKNGTCMSLSKIVLPSMTQEMRKKYPLRETLNEIDNLLSGKDLSEFRTKSLFDGWKKSLEFNKLFFATAKSKDGNNTPFLPTYDQVKNEALNFAHTTLGEIIGQEENNKEKGINLGTLAPNAKDNTEIASVISSGGDIKEKAKKVNDLIIEEEASNYHKDEGQASQTNLDLSDISYKAYSESLYLSQENLFDKISVRYQKIYWVQ